jgi:hypothetical protein
MLMTIFVIPAKFVVSTAGTRDPPAIKKSDMNILWPAHSKRTDDRRRLPSLLVKLEHRCKNGQVHMEYSNRTEVSSSTEVSIA